MSFDWLKYLDLAKRLVEQDDEESARSAISRAYYAAYWCARKKLNDERAIRNHGGSAHSYVWDCYQTERNDKNESIGDLGRILHGHRKTADYTDSMPVSQTDAKLRILQAEQLIKDINNLP